MNYIDFKNLKSAEDDFWYSSRAELIANILKKNLHPPYQGKILDIGSGTGNNIDIIARFGQLRAVDSDPRALAAAQKQKRSIELFDIETEDIKGRFSAITMFDVLEHLRDDGLAVKKVQQALEPGGCFLLTVPAWPWLFGGHDRAAGHYRRYTRAQLRAKLKQNGFSEIKLYYWNIVLFPAEVMYRLFFKLMAKFKKSAAMPQTDAKKRPAILNYIFYKIMSWEAKYLFARPAPPGLSIYGWAVKK